MPAQLFAAPLCFQASLGQVSAPNSRKDTDFRMHREQQRILQLPFRVDSGKSFRHVAVLVDCDLFHAQNICRAVHVRHLKFSFSLIWLVMTEQRKKPCSPSALPKTMKFPAWLQKEPDHLPMRFSCLPGEGGSSKTSRPRHDHHYPRRRERWLCLRGTLEPKAPLAVTRTASGYTRRQLVGSVASTAELLQRLSLRPCFDPRTPQAKAPRSRPRRPGSFPT